MQVRASANGGTNGEYVFAYGVEIRRDSSEDRLEGHSLQALWLHRSLSSRHAPPYGTLPGPHGPNGPNASATGPNGPHGPLAGRVAIDTSAPRCGEAACGVARNQVGGVGGGKASAGGSAGVPVNATAKRPAKPSSQDWVQARRSSLRRHATGIMIRLGSWHDRLRLCHGDRDLDPLLQMTTGETQMTRTVQILTWVKGDLGSPTITDKPTVTGCHGGTDCTANGRLRSQSLVLEESRWLESVCVCVRGRVIVCAVCRCGCQHASTCRAAMARSPTNLPTCPIPLSPSTPCRKSCVRFAHRICTSWLRSFWRTRI